jgi:hypothetical protein
VTADGDSRRVHTTHSSRPTGFRLLHGRCRPAAAEPHVLVNALNVSRAATVSSNFSQALTTANYDVENAYIKLRQRRRRLPYGQWAPPRRI